MDDTFEDLVSRELPGLLRFATALTGNREQGHDIVAEVLAKAYERWDRIKHVDRPAAYLTRMITNEYVSWRRRWSTRVIRPAGDDVLERTAPPTADHGERIVDRDALDRQIATLPRKQQVALVLRYYEELDYPEIAGILGCAESTVRSNCHRALAALRLAGDDPSTGPRRATTARPVTSSRRDVS